jgi:cell division protein FtsN
VIASPEPAIGTTTGTPVLTLDEDVTRQAPDQSPRVLKRPETLDTTASATPATTTTTTPVTRATIAVGEPVVQLGAFTTRQLAERVWKDQKVMNQRLFGGAAATITPVQSGGRELFRLRVGPFASADDAKRICVVLKTRGTDCIVTRAE